MKKSLTMGVLSIGAAMAAAPALAGNDCFVPIAKWQPRQAVKAVAEAKGWKVTRIKVDDGCYHVDGHDAEGREVEVNFDPETLDVVSFHYDNE